MDSQRKSQLGICYECTIKENDSSQKQVYHCDLCKEWFCEKHLKPKFPYFVDWDTVFDVQGDPRIKALFHFEHNRKDGHADLNYVRKEIESFNLEEKVKEEMIAKAMDRMMHPEKYGIEPCSEIETDNTKRVEILLKEENALTEQPESVIGRYTKTFGNIHNHHFSVETKIYYDEEYRPKLDNARTLAEVEKIVKHYEKHHREKKG
jgi:hypothetical protein